MMNCTPASLSAVLCWRRAVACAWCLALLPLFGNARAQLIPVKTVPLAEGDQFGFLPSANLGMGGVTIALADSLLDPFTNPATAARIRRGHFFGSPTVYSISRNAGSGRTLPLGALLRSGSWFGGLAGAVQEITPAKPQDEFLVPAARVAASATFVGTAPPERQPRTNQYASAMLGRVIPKHGLSFGASGFWYGLNVMDGVDQLYAGSQSVAQSGQALDFRFGVLKEWDGDRSLEAVVVHNRFGVTHDVNFVDFFWDPGTRQIVPALRVVHNAERAYTSGVQLQYQRPFADSGWRIGGIVTANRTSQPKIADYELMSVPRAPGQSSAFDLGLGVSKSQGPATFGVDAIYEPIWDHTRTALTENRFRFSNAIVRAGVSREFSLPSPNSSLRLQLGVQLKTIHYWLDEYDSARPPQLDVEESWTEWTNSFGLSFRFPEVEVHYRYRSTRGTDRPGVGNVGNQFIALDAVNTTPGFFPGPTSALTMFPVRVMTQQFSVSVPIR